MMWVHDIMVGVYENEDTYKEKRKCIRNYVDSMHFSWAIGKKHKKYNPGC